MKTYVPIENCSNDISLKNLFQEIGCENHQNMKIRPININEIFKPFGLEPWGSKNGLEDF